MDSLINPQSPWLTLVFVALAVWAIPWKGWALWKAARAGSKVWFVVLLIINTVGILDILYIFIFSKKTSEKKIEPVA